MLYVRYLKAPPESSFRLGELCKASSLMFTCRTTLIAGSGARQQHVVPARFYTEARDENGVPASASSPRLADDMYRISVRLRRSSEVETAARFPYSLIHLKHLVTYYFLLSRSLSVPNEPLCYACIGATSDVRSIFITWSFSAGRIVSKSVVLLFFFLETEYYEHQLYSKPCCAAISPGQNTMYVGC